MTPTLLGAVAFEPESIDAALRRPSRRPVVTAGVSLDACRHLAFTDRPLLRTAISPDAIRRWRAGPPDMPAPRFHVWRGVEAGWERLCDGATVEAVRNPAGGTGGFETCPTCADRAATLRDGWDDAHGQWAE